MRFRNDIYDKLREENKPIKKKIEKYETSVDEEKEDKVDNAEEQIKSQEDIEGD